jgi:hypothetical protein
MDPVEWGLRRDRTADVVTARDDAEDLLAELATSRRWRRQRISLAASSVSRRLDDDDARRVVAVLVD